MATYSLFNCSCVLALRRRADLVDKNMRITTCFPRDQVVQSWLDIMICIDIYIYIVFDIVLDISSVYPDCIGISGLILLYICLYMSIYTDPDQLARTSKVQPAILQSYRCGFEVVKLSWSSEECTTQYLQVEIRWNPHFSRWNPHFDGQIPCLIIVGFQFPSSRSLFLVRSRLLFHVNT